MQLVVYFEIIRNTSLREKCPYLKLFWSAFSHIRTKYGEILHISQYSVQMRNGTHSHLSIDSFMVHFTNTWMLLWNTDSILTLLPSVQRLRFISTLQYSVNNPWSFSAAFYLANRKIWRKETVKPKIQTDLRVIKWDPASIFFSSWTFPSHISKRCGGIKEYIKECVKGKLIFFKLKHHDLI